ncbi:MAG: LamG domain-containing protein, partial [Candidatus Thalassarchaeaceae archaeon]|nr:LamG domain-containing protein [Candidatus Thalassarchaeaceae archaeon]
AGTVSVNGDAAFTGTGKMGNGLSVDGSGDSAESGTTSIDTGGTWSIEAWMKTDDTSDGTIVFLGDFDGNDEDNDLSIGLGSSDEVKLCEDSCTGFGKSYTTSGVNLATDTWYHVAVTHDGSNGINIFVNGEGKSISGLITIDAASSPKVVLGEGDLHGDFSGVIDDVRMVNYERGAFAGGIMISKVVPSTDKVTLYNAGSTSYEISGLRLNDGRSGGDPTICWNAGFSTDTIAAGGTLEVDCNVDADDGLFLQDLDGDNDNSIDIVPDPPGKAWTIDGVCWNDGSGTDSECNGSNDPMIAAGVWAVGVYMDMSEGDGDTLHLKTNGNNDEGADDWYVPEFSTLLMPIASVLLIVGYNYRRREALD